MNKKEQYYISTKLIDNLDDIHTILEDIKNDLETYIQSLEKIMEEEIKK